MSRAKLINAIIYFEKNTKYCQKTKLFKLLFLLDFHHYKETGKSVTGLVYEAWKMGPVSKELFSEMKHGMKSDLSSKIDLVIDDLDNTTQIIPKVDFDSSIFSRRELRIMETISKDYQYWTSKTLVDLTHADNEPWDITIKTKGQNSVIDYDLALKDGTSLTKEIVEQIKINEEDANLFRKNLSKYSSSH